MLKEKINSALTKTFWVQKGKSKKLEHIEVPPSERIVLGIVFAIAALICLVVIEVAHMAFLHTWNSEIFSTITGLIGTVSGVLIGSHA